MKIRLLSSTALMPVVPVRMVKAEDVPQPITVNNVPKALHVHHSLAYSTARLFGRNMVRSPLPEEIDDEGMIVVNSNGRLFSEVQ